METYYINSTKKYWSLKQEEVHS